MLNRIYIITIGLLISACGSSIAQYEKKILGDWKEVKRIYKPGTYGAPNNGNSGFTFYPKNSYDNKQGFFNVVTNGVSFLGYSSKYTLKNDSLILFTPQSKETYTQKIYKLSKDSLIIGNEYEKTVYARYKTNINQSPQFDRIVLSTSGCFGKCPVITISIDKTGFLLFEGKRFTTKTGIYESVISKNLYKQLQDKFRQTDFTKLASDYSGSGTDDQIVSVTFLKNGRVFKTVSDYGRTAPAEFTWVYPAWTYLYQHVNLKKVRYYDLLQGYHIRGHFKKDSSILVLSQSEDFLLYDMLRNGKRISQKAPAVYFMDVANEDEKIVGKIVTDGRYYTFLEKGKTITIDIGFNFVTDIEKFHKWRAAGEYD
ncbi:MAG: hypothetical protein EOO47_25590 [Flavobacterium sp.]|nr:MAG: hypothetical protein EOO47_25590 [Flavobacterium sp.]